MPPIVQLSSLAIKKMLSVVGSIVKRNIVWSSVRSRKIFDQKFKAGRILFQIEGRLIRAVNWVERARSEPDYPENFVPSFELRLSLIF